MDTSASIMSAAYRFKQSQYQEHVVQLPIGMVARARALYRRCYGEAPTDQELVQAAVLQLTRKMQRACNDLSTSSGGISFVR